jgi:DNA-nicking Smr family endonuclease
MSRRRQLSDEERALWAGFARSIAPLRQPRGPAKASEADLISSTAIAVSDRARAPSVAKPRPVSAPEAGAPALLGRRLKARVARGRDPIDARIDLHGMTQTQAHAALLSFLHRAQAHGARTALIVTGKGSGKAGAGASNDAIERGVLKRQVPMWLALPEFRPFIVAFDDAHVGHGGHGALYVRLRRAK